MAANQQVDGGFRKVVPKPGEETYGTLLEADPDTPLSRKYRWELDVGVKVNPTLDPLGPLWRQEYPHFHFRSPDFSFGGALWIMTTTCENGDVKISLVLRDTACCLDSVGGAHWKIALTKDYKENLKSVGGYSSIIDGEAPRVIGTLPERWLGIGSTRDILRVALELRLKSAPKDASSQTEQKSRTERLACDLKKLLLSGDASDATVRVKGRDFPVHRCILAARTPVFASMFRHEMSERETGLVDIEDCEPETFQRFLQYVYAGGEEDLDPVDASALYEVADKYQVDELKADCLEVIIKRGLSVDSFCSTLAFAHKHEETQLLEMAAKFFSSNYTRILPRTEWVRFLAKHPAQANEMLVESFVA